MKGTLKGCEMADLFEQVYYHMEGSETEIQNWETLDGIKTVEFHSFGPDRWIESVHERGRMTGIECLAIILFAVDVSLCDPEPARRIVESWAAELRKAINSGEIQARDPVTLLALETLPNEWEWLLSMADADRFIAARGMEWRFGEVVLHLFNQFEQAIQNRRFPAFVRTAPAQTPDTPAPAPVVAASDSPAKPAVTVDRGWVMKKSALIDKHAHQWDTIKGDFHSASENGLSKAAKAPGHGEWFEAEALDWAEQRGKLKKEKQQGPANSIFNLAGTKHTLEG